MGKFLTAIICIALVALLHLGMCMDGARARHAKQTCSASLKEFPNATGHDR